MAAVLGAALALALAVFVSAGGRAKAEAPSGRYAVLETSVKDRRTTLTWRRAVSPDLLTWPAAKASCDAIRGGKWRLPTAMELMTIVDARAAAPAIDAAAFPNTPQVKFWTATPYVRSPGSYWTVDFTTGSLVGSPDTSPLAVRCVSDEAVAPAP